MFFLLFYMFYIIAIYTWDDFWFFPGNSVGDSQDDEDPVSHSGYWAARDYQALARAN